MVRTVYSPEYCLQYLEHYASKEIFVIGLILGQVCNYSETIRVEIVFIHHKNVCSSKATPRPDLHLVYVLFSTNMSHFRRQMPVKMLSIWRAHRRTKVPITPLKPVTQKKWRAWGISWECLKHGSPTMRSMWLEC